MTLAIFANICVSENKGSLNLHKVLKRDDQDGRVVKALDLSSNGRVVHVGSNPTPGIFF